MTYGEAFTVQPFNNLVVTQDLTGAQIKDTLEQSFIGCFGRTQATVILQVSAEFHYTYDTTLAVRQPDHGDHAQRRRRSIRPPRTRWR